jgi:hypothetical protein
MPLMALPRGPFFRHARCYTVATLLTGDEGAIDPRGQAQASASGPYHPHVSGWFARLAQYAARRVVRHLVSATDRHALSPARRHGLARVSGHCLPKPRIVAAVRVH